MTMSLPKVIKEFNTYMKITRQRQVEPRSLTVGDSIRIARYIDNQLDTEVLTRDGELNWAQATKEKMKLMMAARQLKGKGFRISQEACPNIAIYDISLVTSKLQQTII